tara:strand:- start:71 stop:1015 length:945 start_codon:yes stop_codon:yes gene_type:complete
MSLVDYPSQRSNHSLLVPKGAGIVLVPLLVISAYGIFLIKDSFDKQWLIFFLSIIILYVISLLDDIKNLSAPVRLFTHFLCVAISVFALKEDISLFIQNNFATWLNFNLHLLFYVLSLILIVLWIWIINLFNFMDGMDGLTCVQVLTLSLTINILCLLELMNENFQFISLILISLFLAFYKFNKPSASVFLGDVGSIPIGYISGLFLIYSFLKNGPVIPVLIVFLYYFFDSTFTLILRLIRRKNIFEAHSDHFYQKILRAGQTHQQVLNKIIILLFFLFILSMTSIKYPMISIMLGITLTFGFLIFLKKQSKNE